MKSLSSEEKVCNACRTAYYVWKTNNAEFGNLFSRIEGELSNGEEAVNIDPAKEKIIDDWIYVDTHINCLSLDETHRRDDERSGNYYFTNELHNFIS